MKKGTAGFLHLHISLTKRQHPSPSLPTYYAFLVQLGYEDICVLTGSLNRTLARTWRTNAKYGFRSEQTIEDDIKGAIRDMVDEFANDFLKANPKSSS